MVGKPSRNIKTGVILMINYLKTLDTIAEIKHQLWVKWSKDVVSTEKLSNDQIKHWKKSWKSYDNLPEEAKEEYREWAEKILTLVPNKCPIHQCGGLMNIKERKIPKDMIESEHFNGDEQTPDLVCSNCGGVYQFQRFKNEKNTKKH